MKLKALSVTHVTSYIRKLMLNDPILYNLRVKGEISNLKIHSSKNAYFSLKDENSKLKCIMFADNISQNAEKLEEGINIIASGYISVYERDGAVQLYVREFETEGKGDLYSNFLKLKDKLEKEGLFDVSAKKMIPRMPSTIGVITSETGAVIRDIINVIKRRFPKVSIKLYPASVQGKSSAQELISGLQIFNEMSGIDVIILGRGGGAIEELNSFNDENLARAIAASRIPVISAVGHETDYTISDFVSDMRAPTPSAAAELCVPSLLEMEYRLENIKNTIAKDMEAMIRGKVADINGIRENPIFKEPLRMYEGKKVETDTIIEKIEEKIASKINSDKISLGMMGRNLYNMNPLSVLSRGYGIVQKNEKPLKSVSGVCEGDVLNIRLCDGDVECSVTKIFAREDII